MITSGYSHGYSWKYSQPVIDTMTQAKAAGVTAYGIGDDAHWRGCGDHVSKPCTGHPGWIVAVDLMTDSSFNAVDFVKAFVLPLVKAGYFPEIQYLLTDYGLWDRLYGWRTQSGGDGPDHAHISFTHAYTARSNVFDLYQAWKRAGRPPVVAWMRDGGNASDNDYSGAHALSTVKLANGKFVTVVVGTDKHLYASEDLGRTFAKLDNGNWAPGVGAATRTGTDLHVATRDADGCVYLSTWTTYGDPKTYSRQDRMGGGVWKFSGPVELVPNGADLYMIGRGTDKAVWAIAWTGGKWRATKSPAGKAL